MLDRNRVRLAGRVFLSGTVEAVTGLHIGGAATEMSIGGVDNPIIRDPLTQRPYIPGSSLKGKMRSLTEKAEGSHQNRRSQNIVSVGPSLWESRWLSSSSCGYLAASHHHSNSQTSWSISR